LQRLIWSGFALIVLAAAVAVLPAPTHAAPPWATIVPFKRIDADPNKTYELEESHGPWLILTASFAGPQAEEQAHDLVMELRQRYKWEAYTFRQVFDFSQPTEGLGLDKYGGKKKMKHLHAAKFHEIAVMVGNFSSVDDPELEKTLEKIKFAKPEVLAREGNSKTQRMATVRTLYKFVDSNPLTKTKGPMGSAFVSRNPLLPKEYFAAQGLDPFLVQLNRDLPDSLLECPGKYSVRVATFRGVDTMKPAEFEKLTRDRSRIDEAANKAYALCEALRKQGVEAYQFHDRTESIVTIGSFNSVGAERADGKTEINPALHEVMKKFSPVEKRLPGQTGLALVPVMVGNIVLDSQPLPIEVPRESIVAAYNPTKLMR